MLPGTGLDDIIAPTSQKYYDRLHDLIMARIDETEIEVPTRASKVLNKPTRMIREQVQLWMASRET
jgi:hypothetical protein